MQFVGKVITSVSEFYKDINPSTLSGAIDVLVVRDVESGELVCSPFHVRFGKLHLLRPQEKVVEVRVNGEPVELGMKVGEAGEAFWVLPAAGGVEEGLLTSPLVSPLPTLFPSTADSLTLAEDATRRRPKSPDSEGETTTATSTSHLKIPIHEGGAVSDSEFEVNAAPLLGVSPPKYSWMWGDLPIQTNKRHTLVSSDDDVVSNVKIEEGLIDELELSSEKSTIEVKENTNGDTETKETTTPTPTSTSTCVDIFEYIHRPGIFKLNYNELIKLSNENVSISIVKPAENIIKGGSLSIVENTSLADFFEKNEEKFIYITMNQYLDSSVNFLNELINFGDVRKNPYILRIGEDLAFSAPIGLFLLIGKMLFGEIPSYEACIKKFPSLDPNPATKPVSSGWRWWNRSSAQSALSPSPTAVSATSQSPSPSLQVECDTNSSTSLVSTNNNTTVETKYQKSLRLPHELLSKFHLNDGMNTITYTVTTKLQGVATCSARIFLWPSDARLVISDVDGTITKSDALGHLFAFVGRDWTHSDIARLYTQIASNGYRFIYLTSRSLGQANSTRGYLRGVEQNGRFQLPDGPVIMSPDRLMAALRREVVIGNPQEFKIACLLDLQRLFHTNSPVDGELNPFYAGFGNRTNDAAAYTAIGIPSQRIFIVNPAGTVAVEPLSDYYNGSYARLFDLVDSMFPPLSQKSLASAVESEFNDFWYWRRPPATDLILDVNNSVVAVLEDGEIPMEEDEDTPHGYGDEEEEEGLVPVYV